MAKTTKSNSKKTATTRKIARSYGLKVVKKQGESDDKLIARFKKKVLNAGIIQEARDKSRHTTKAERRKEQKARVKHLIELEKKRN